jgi:uncharacterized glyoxalase superfamily protein PhnB
VKAKAATLYPFVPSGPRFDEAKAFLGELGFDAVWQQDGLAGLRYGGAYLILQDIDVPQWQANQMLVIEVDDLDAYWAELSAKGLTERFPGARLKPPTDYPWGREVHIVDPGGVCWHVRGPFGRRSS